VAAIVVAVLTLGGDDTEPKPTQPPVTPAETASPTGPTGPTVESPTPTLTGPTAPTGATGPVTASNTESIGIPDFGEAVEYPSVIEVSGVAGPIADVDVTLDGLTHTFADDVDVLLVGPSGESVVLMADVGGDIDNGVTGLTLTFDDGAAPLPDRAPLASGLVRPTAGTASGRDGSCCGFQGGAPAPPAPHGEALAVFIGTDPNGTWSLFVFDDTAGDVGEIAGGWSLEIGLAV
jgi:subtilisin-like proprotein convertase family protein